MKNALLKLIMFLMVMCFPIFSIVAQHQKEKSQSVWSWFWDLMMEEINYSGNSNNSQNPQELMKDLNLKIGLKGLGKFHIGDNLEWKKPAFNDSNWEKIQVPADWENEGYNGYDGYAWYRLQFDGRSLNPRDIHYLILGFIDDVDETYINGELIGKSGSFPPRNRTAYNSFRKYPVPTDVINFKGKNVISVRVYDEMGNGGIVGGDIGLYVSQKKEDVVLLQNLKGIWKFSKQNKGDFKNPNLNDSDWEDIVVPAYWDNHGYKTFDGTAWYRKEFMLSFKADVNKKYYLVLGRIDDFDETYLNGILIGETIDGKGLGNSESYLKTRIYRIPTALLKTDKNVIAVKVQDIGLDGGIYEGPIGIYEEADLIYIKK
jgi:hypothetical protein